MTILYSPEEWRCNAGCGAYFVSEDGLHRKYFSEDGLHRKYISEDGLHRKYFS
jgi:hypothetical protein